MKAKIDYRNKQWQHSSNILDTVRCGVTFDNIDIFFHQFNMPDGKILVSNNQNEKCLNGIVRIKNDFSSLELDRNNLNGYHYCDVKCNMLIEYGVRLTSEMQKNWDIQYIHFKENEYYDKLSQINLT